MRFVFLLTLPLLAQPNPRCAALKSFALPAVTITEAAHSATPHPACVVRGEIDRRIGTGGRTFYIGFELRLPNQWQNRFLFSGGGGMDGYIRPAINGLDRGFAVVTTDTGHQADPVLREADPSFATDQQARLDNGHRSIDRVTATARAIVTHYYGAPPKYSYLDGCSNGGRQGLMAAQRYPALFDGIVSGAPAFRVPHAAIGAAWETIALTAIAPKDASGRPILSRAFSNADLDILATAIRNSCDAADGLADGLVFNTEACRRFDPTPLTCPGPKAPNCLSKDQIETLKQIQSGPVTSKGVPIYSDWPYDPGMASPGWRMLKLGTSESATPNSRGITLMLSGLKGYFLTPYDPNFDAMKFDFDKDTQRVNQSTAEVEATATMLSSFSNHGKLLLYHGMADPYFSAWDTVRYFQTLQSDNGGQAETSNWARLFLVPGMTHCAGGPSLDQFDRLGAIIKWVEQNQPPAQIDATGRTFPGLTRPLCPYPSYTHYNGQSFTCR